MVFLEILVVILIILVAIVLWKLLKKEEKPKEEKDLANQLLLKKLENIDKTLDKKAEADEKREEKTRKFIEENISSFTRTIHGTKRRGKVGEELLKEILSEPIKANLIVTDLPVDNGTVEFAWDLKNGKFLPIDSKMPELEQLYNEFDKTEDIKEQLKFKKEIIKVLENRKKEANKYLNNHNTIDKVVIAVPDSISDMIPDINKDAFKTGIFVSGYTKVFLFVCILGEYYIKALESGDIGIYKQTIGAVKNMLYEIEKRSNAINKGVTQITNANSKVKTELEKASNKIGQLTLLESANIKKLENK